MTCEGYCVKCKKKVEMKDPKESKTKKGTKIAKGKCPVCGTTVCRMGGIPVEGKMKKAA